MQIDCVILNVQVFPNTSFMTVSNRFSDYPNAEENEDWVRNILFGGFNREVQFLPYRILLIGVR